MVLSSRNIGVSSQNDRIAMDFCNQVQELFASGRYSEDVITQTVDSILQDLGERDRDLKVSIQNELIQCWPHIKWSFNKNPTSPRTIACNC
jgi:hypothetical protein